MPFIKHSLVTSINFSLLESMLPTANVFAWSPKKPWWIDPTSIPIISPFINSRLLGTPWTTSSLIDTHNVPGNPYKPLNAGTAPWSRMKFSAYESSSNVVTPGLTIFSSSKSRFFTILAARLIFSISLLDLILIILLIFSLTSSLNFTWFKKTIIVSSN